MFIAFLLPIYCTNIYGLHKIQIFKYDFIQKKKWKFG